jgi:8-oxo-dGTP diphosphatase
MPPISFREKDQKRFRLKVGVFLVLIENDHVLLLRRFNTGIEDGDYVLPMGGLNGTETAHTTVIREAFEETGIIIHQEDIQLALTMHRYHQQPDGYSFQQIDLFFKTSSYKGTPKNAEPDKCDDVRFF